MYRLFFFYDIRKMNTYIKKGKHLIQDQRLTESRCISLRHADSACKAGGKEGGKEERREGGEKRKREYGAVTGGGSAARRGSSQYICRVP